jgi:multidrug resistance efflux pump
MDVKQLRQLCRKLMKANKTLIVVNEKLHKDKQEIERQHEQKLQMLEKENETFKRLLKAEDKLNSVDEILSKNTIEALKTELASKGTTSSEDVKTVANEEYISEFSQSENDVRELETVGSYHALVIPFNWTQDRYSLFQ